MIIKSISTKRLIQIKSLSLICLINSINCFGWDAWNNNLLQSISDCPTFDGNRTGICVSSASECRNSKCFSLIKQWRFFQHLELTNSTTHFQGAEEGLAPATRIRAASMARASNTVANRATQRPSGPVSALRLAFAVRVSSKASICTEFNKISK